MIAERWLAIARSVEPIDIAAAEGAIAACYLAAGLPAPARTYWAASPLAAGVLTLSAREEHGPARFGVSPYYRSIEEVMLGLTWQEHERLFNFLARPEFDALTGLHGATQPRQSWSATLGAYFAATAAAARGEQPDHPELAVSEMITALTVTDAAGHLGIELSLNTRAVQRWGLSGHWAWLYDDAAVACHRPVYCAVDQWGREHDEYGPAIEYADGFAVYAWHGTRVPASVITEQWDARDVLEEPNLEVRRCAIEKMGWETFLEQAEVRRIGPPAPDPGNLGFELALYESTAGLMPHERLLVCVNGTADPDGVHRRYGLWVPDDLEDALAAAAWTYGLSAAQYARAQRRS